MNYSTLVYMVARFVPAGLTMYTLYFYTNKVSPEDYGNFTNIVSTASLIYPVMFAPVWYFILRYRLEKGNEIISRSNSVVSIILLAILLLSVGAHSLLPRSQSAYVVATLFMIALFGVFQVRLEQQRSAEMPKHYLKLAAMRSFLILIISIGFIKLEISMLVSPIVDATILGIFVATIPADFEIIKNNKFQNFISNVKEIYSYGFFLALGLVVNTGLFSIDRLIIYHFGDAHLAGLYSSPYDLAMKLVYTVVFSLELSMLPALLREKKLTANLSHQFESNLKTYICILTPIVVTLIIFSDVLCRFYFPAHYFKTASQIFPVIVLSTYLVGFAHAIFHHAYILTGDSLKYFITIFAVFLLNVTVNVIVNILGHPFESSIVALITFIIYVIATYRYSSSVYDFKFPLLYMAKIIGICLPMLFYRFFVITEPNFLSLTVGFSCCLLVYFILAFVFNISNFRDRILLEFGKCKSKLLQN